MSPSSVRVRLVSLYASRFDQWTAHLGLTRYAVAKAMGNPGAPGAAEEVVART